MKSKLTLVLGTLAGALLVHTALVWSGGPTARAQGSEVVLAHAATRVLTAETDPAQLERFDVPPAHSDANGALPGVAITDGPFVVTALHTTLVLHLWVVPRGADCGAIGSSRDVPGKLLTSGSHSSYQSASGSRFVVKVGETLCAANGVADNPQLLARANASNDSVSGFRPY
jgi:hypothetical protein